MRLKTSCQKDLPIRFTNGEFKKKKQTSWTYGLTQVRHGMGSGQPLRLKYPATSTLKVLTNTVVGLIHHSSHPLPTMA